MLSEQAQIAKACRTYLKSIGVKGSCTSESFAGGTAVNVDMSDLNPKLHEEISTELGKYQIGHFDGMTDMYEYSNRNADIPQTKYLHINNSFSPELKQRAWEFIHATYADAKDLANTYSELSSNDRIGDEWATDFMWRYLNNYSQSQEFWQREATPKANKTTTPKANNNAVNTITVSAGKREGFTEIRFPEKPDSDTLTELKSAGYRWSRFNSCWWGKTDKLPESFKTI